MHVHAYIYIINVYMCIYMFYVEATYACMHYVCMDAGIFLSNLQGEAFEILDLF